jgi:hypothetical protein
MFIDEEFECVVITMASTSKKPGQLSGKHTLTPESRQHNEPIAKRHQSSDSHTPATG